MIKPFKEGIAKTEAVDQLEINPGTYSSVHIISMNPKYLKVT